MKALLTLTLSAMALGGCGSSATINYRMIVEVEDDGAIRVGSGVWQFKITENVPLGGRSYTPEFRGEAIAVDLPGKGTLFVLGQGPNADMQMVAEKVFRKDAEALLPRSAPRHEVNATIASLVGRTKLVPCRRLTGESVPTDPVKRLQPNFCPFMVRFRDINDPASVEEVDIANPAEAFGPGVRVRQMLVQITDEPVSTGIGKWMPWLASHVGKQIKLSGKPFGAFSSGPDEPTADRLSISHFSTELEAR